MAGEYLASIQYDAWNIPAIAHTVYTHRYRSVEKPVTLEAKILSDADKLDAMDAVGIARTFIWAGEYSGTINDGIDYVHEKLLNLQDMRYTEKARHVARKRHPVLSRFLDTLKKEMVVPR